jgi:sugar phosphate permease
MGTGIAFGSVIPLATTVSRWFTRMRGKAMAIALTASSVAGLVFAPSINFIIETLGLTWRQAWLCVAAIMVIPIVIALLFIREYPADIGQEPDGGMDEAKTAEPNNDALRTTYEWTPKEAYKTASFWFIVIATCVTQYPFVFFTTQWIRAMRSFDFSPARAAFGVSVFTIMSLPSRLIAGVLLDKIRPKFVFMMGFACTIIAYIISLFVSASSLAAAYTTAAFAALGFGLSYISYQTVTAQFFGIKAYPKLSGIVLMIAAIFTAPASLIASSLFGKFGSFTPAFILNVVIAVVGFVFVLFLKMPKNPRQPN